MSSLLDAKDIKAYYRFSSQFVRAVDGVTLNIDYGDILGIAGESGSGKSTLGNVLMMNIRPPLQFMEGRIILEGKYDLTMMTYQDLKSQIWGRVIALVPQNALNVLIPTRKVQDFIIDVLKVHQKLRKKDAVQLARQRFQDVGLPVEVLIKYPHQLSGGMRQRVVIAIATLLSPKILIADEPTSALDVSTQKQVLKMLLQLHVDNIVKSTILITHDIAILRQVAIKIGIMYAGKIIETAPADQLLQTPLHPYTRGLIQCVVTPEPEISKRGLTHIPGEPPDLIRPPSGCRFHPRCMHAELICIQEEPPLTFMTNHHMVACHLATRWQACSL
ncbi:MAG: ABC transporter ATP-binding protein [Candidatus Bipolaricaulota bacterium]|nr:ABC transporter ATP-binding protein [Candidatus Bipolaricaulota bacterium]MDW8127063.1 ABC transporter ATP-binding protein [Candidatus Bipolaricaulota bacterium]